MWSLCRGIQKHAEPIALDTQFTPSLLTICIASLLACWHLATKALCSWQCCAAFVRMPSKCSFLAKSFFAETSQSPPEAKFVVTTPYLLKRPLPTTSAQRRSQKDTIPGRSLIKPD